MTSATRLEKLVFWLLLGLFSAAIPEVVTGNKPFVLLSPEGLFIVPIYLLHVTFLAGLVLRYADAIGWQSLYLAGGLFGLYEAYLTKVLWSPIWDPIPVTVGGVYVFVALVLVLFLHPLLAFVLPLLAVERLCTVSRLGIVGLPPRIGSFVERSPRVAAVAVAVVIGLLQGALASGIGPALVSALGTAAVLLVAVAAWRRLVGTDGYDLADLLPAGRELLGLGVLLVILYAAYGIGLRPEHLPGLAGQATVWLLYLFFGGLLGLQLRSDRRLGAPAARRVPLVPLATAGSVASAYVVATALGGLLLRPVALAVHVVLLLVAILVGGAALGRIVTDLGRERRALRVGSLRRGLR